METPRISVIIPAYNVERYIRICVETILSNTFKDFEIIIVNDGSTDFTYSILQSLADIDERVRIFNQSNLGPGEARNFGMKKARGEYFTFVDGDDYVNEYYLEKLYQQVLDYDAKLVITEYYRYQEKNNMCYFHVFETDYRIEKIEQKELINRSNELVFTIGCAKLFHRSLFDDVTFPKGMYYEDSWIINKLYLQVPFAIFVVENLYCYRLTDNSIVGSDLSVKKIEDNLKSIEEGLLDLLVSNNDVSKQMAVYQTMLASHRDYLVERGLHHENVYKKIIFRLSIME